MTRGRPATGRNSKCVRVPLDMNVELAVTVYYEWLPIIEQYRNTTKDTVRYDRLNKLLEELKT